MEKHNFRSVIATASLVLGLSGVGPAHADIFGGFLGAASPGTTDASSPQPQNRSPGSLKESLNATTLASVGQIWPSLPQAISTIKPTWNSY